MALIVSHTYSLALAGWLLLVALVDYTGKERSSVTHEAHPGCEGNA